MKTFDLLLNYYGTQHFHAILLTRGYKKSIIGGENDIRINDCEALLA